MKINSIHFKNYRQYVDNTYNLESADGLAINIANNGVGKSTMRNGVLIALYGQEALREQLFKNVSYDDYSKLLSKYCQEGGTTSFIIDFTIKENNSRYVLTRSFDFSSPKLKKPVCKSKLIIETGQLTQNTITNNAEISAIINQIMPLQLAKFFIFDGESLSKMNMRTSLKNDIEKLMNIDKLKARITVLKIVRTNYSSKLQGSIQHQSELLKLNNDIDNIVKSIDINTERIEIINNELPKLNKIADELHTFILAQKDIEKYQREIDELDNIIKHNTKQNNLRLENMFKFMMSNDFHNYNLKAFYKGVHESMDLTESVGITGIKVEALEYILEQKKCICGHNIDEDMALALENLKLLVPPNDLSSVNKQLLNAIRCENSTRIVDDINEYRQTANKIAMDKIEYKTKKDNFVKTDNIDTQVREYHKIKEDIDTLNQELGTKNIIIRSQKNKQDNKLKEKSKITSSVSANKILNRKIAIVDDMINDYELKILYIENDLLNEIEYAVKKKLDLLDIDTTSFKINRNNYTLNITTTSTGQEILANFTYLVSIFKVISNFSGVEQNRVKFPLILDAPTSGLGQGYIEQLIKLINELGSDVFINILHNAYSNYKDAYTNINGNFDALLYTSELFEGHKNSMSYRWVNNYTTTINEMDNFINSGKANYISVKRKDINE